MSSNEDEEQENSLRQISDLMARWNGERFIPPLSRREIGASVEALEIVAERSDGLVVRSAVARLLPVVKEIHRIDHANLGGDSTRPGWRAQMEAFGESSKLLGALEALESIGCD